MYTLDLRFFSALFEYKKIPTQLIKMESNFKILKFLNYLSISLSVLFHRRRCGQLCHIRFAVTMENKVFPM